MTPTAQVRPLHTPPEPASGTAIPTEVRHAALLLHALAPEDRAWMLGQLDKREQELLRSLLTELEAIGIPADRSLLDEVRASMEPPDPRSAAVRRLAGADPDRLLAALEGEPPGLIARLIAMDEWPWRGALLNGLSPEVRVAVEEHLAVIGPGLGQRGDDEPRGRALREHLVTEALRALAAAPQLGRRRSRLTWRFSWRRR